LSSNNNNPEDIEEPELPPVVYQKYLDVLEDIMKQCKTIVKEKRQIYSDAWYLIPRRTLDHVIAYKSRRMTRIPSKFIDKLIRDHIDVINFCVFALVQLKEDKARH